MRKCEENDAEQISYGKGFELTAEPRDESNSNLSSFFEEMYGNENRIGNSKFWKIFGWKRNMEFVLDRFRFGYPSSILMFSFLSNCCQIVRV